MQEMMFAKGQNFNEYAAFFKRGSFLQTRTVEEALTPDVLARLQDKNITSETIFTRRRVERIEMPIFSRVINREDVIFEGAEPLLQQDEEI